MLVYLAATLFYLAFKCLFYLAATLFCFYPWSCILNVSLFSSNFANISIIAVYVFRNLFWKICPLFGQILITCLKCSSFSPSFYVSCSEKMLWDKVAWSTYRNKIKRCYCWGRTWTVLAKLIEKLNTYTGRCYGTSKIHKLKSDRAVDKLPIQLIIFNINSIIPTCKKLS